VAPVGAIQVMVSAIVAPFGAIQLMLVSAIRLTLAGAIAATAGATRARGAGATQLGRLVAQGWKLTAREAIYRYELRRRDVAFQFRTTQTV